MGNLTTFTVYTDGISEILKGQEAFCKKLYDHALSGEPGTFGHGDHANLVKVQRLRHADDHTMYVHMGNTVTEMNPYSLETQELMQEHPEFFGEMLRYMKQQVSGLEAMARDYRKETAQK